MLHDTLDMWPRIASALVDSVNQCAMNSDCPVDMCGYLGHTMDMRWSIEIAFYDDIYIL